MKSHLTGWETILAHQIADKGLISRMYKEFLQLNDKKNKQPN